MWSSFISATISYLHFRLSALQLLFSAYFQKAFVSRSLVPILCITLLSNAQRRHLSQFPQCIIKIIYIFILCAPYSVPHHNVEKTVKRPTIFYSMRIGKRWSYSKTLKFVIGFIPAMVKHTGISSFSKITNFVETSTYSTWTKKCKAVTFMFSDQL